MIAKFTLSWVLLYTAGLTDAQKFRRRTEVECDMYEQQAFDLERGASGPAIAVTIASRMARGAAADVLWRMEAGRAGEASARGGGNPPLPWFTMWFVSLVIIAAGVATTQAEFLGSGRLMLAILAGAGAGMLWLGLYLATHRIAGPLCIGMGSLGIILGFWWTVFVPVAAVLAGICALRRARRIELLLDGN